MIRRNKTSIIQLAAFVGLGLFIYYITRPSSPKTFNWNTIRYTPTTPIPESRGSCPGLQDSSKPALVVSHVAADGNPTWLDHLKEKYHICVYEVDATDHADHLRVPANRGHESMTYLTFIIDNYNHIPKSGVVAIHANRFQWHNDDPKYDNQAILAALNVKSAIGLNGYHNLRCDWGAGTCPKDSGPPQGSFKTWLNSVVQPWSARSASDAAIPNALATIFGGDEFLRSKNGQGLKLGGKDHLRAQCCAQFVVSREAIHQHSRAEYVALRQWILEAAPSDDRIAGRIMSYLWHILFIPSGDGLVDLVHLNRQACPSAADCYCRLFGRCDLKCRGNGGCYGQYHLPPYLSLPKNWAETHGGNTPRVEL